MLLRLRLLVALPLLLLVVVVHPVTAYGALTLNGTDDALTVEEDSISTASFRVSGWPPNLDLSGYVCVGESPNYSSSSAFGQHYVRGYLNGTRGVWQPLVVTNNFQKTCIQLVERQYSSFDYAFKGPSNVHGRTTVTLEAKLTGGSFLSGPPRSRNFTILSVNDPPGASDLVGVSEITNPFIGWGAKILTGSNLTFSFKINDVDDCCSFINVSASNIVNATVTVRRVTDDKCDIRFTQSPPGLTGTCLRENVASNFTVTVVPTIASASLEFLLTATDGNASISTRVGVLISSSEEPIVQLENSDVIEDFPTKLKFNLDKLTANGANLTATFDKPDPSIGSLSNLTFSSRCSATTAPRCAPVEVIFTPAANFVGDVTLSGSIADDDGNSVSGNFTLTVSAVNDPPALVDPAMFQSVALEETSVSSPGIATDRYVNFGMIDVDSNSLSVIVAQTSPSTDLNTGFTYNCASKPCTGFFIATVNQSGWAQFCIFDGEANSTFYNVTFTVVSTPPPSPLATESEGMGFDLIYIIIIVVGSVLVLLACVGLTVFVLSNRSRQKEEAGSDGSESADDSNEDLAKWTLSLDEVELGKELARGNFGVVYQGVFRGNDCVVKQLHAKPAKNSSGDDEEERAREEFLAEARVLSHVKPHASIVAFFGCNFETSPMFLVTEFIDGGSLQSWLTNPSKKLRVNDACSLSMDLASGLSYIHALLTVHRDVAARNALIKREPSGSKAMKLAICDFGLSKMLPKGEKSLDASGTMFPTRWTAPEVYREGRYYAESDCYAWGITCWEILTRGALPHADTARNRDVVQKITSGVVLQFPEDLASSEALTVLQQQISACWKQDPCDRPSMKKVSDALRAVIADAPLDEICGKESEEANVDAPHLYTAFGGRSTAVAGGEQYESLYAPLADLDDNDGLYSKTPAARGSLIPMDNHYSKTPVDSHYSKTPAETHYSKTPNA